MCEIDNNSFLVAGGTVQKAVPGSGDDSDVEFMESTDAFIVNLESSSCQLVQKKKGVRVNEFMTGFVQVKPGVVMSIVKDVHTTGSERVYHVVRLDREGLKFDSVEKVVNINLEDCVDDDDVQDHYQDGDDDQADGYGDPYG